MIFGMNLGPHADFIVASYGAAAGVVLLLLVWVIADRVTQRRRLAALEAQGVTRRSEHAVGSPA